LAAFTIAIPSGTKLILALSNIFFNSSTFSLIISVSGFTVILNLLCACFISFSNNLKYLFLSFVYNFFKYSFIFHHFHQLIFHPFLLNQLLLLLSLTSHFLLLLYLIIQYIFYHFFSLVLLL